MKATTEMTYTSHHNTQTLCDLVRKIKMIQQLSSHFLEKIDGYD